MEYVACVVNERAKSDRAGAARIVWYCASLLLTMGALIVVSPIILSPSGAEAVYWVIVGFAESAPEEVVLESMAQALMGSSGSWVVPALLWVPVTLYMAVDVVYAFSAWREKGSEGMMDKLARVRPILRWVAAFSMAVLLVTGFGVQVLREGYTRHPEIWFEGDGSAIPGVVALLVGGVMLPVSLALAVWLKRRVARVARRMMCEDSWRGGLVRFGRAAGNGVLGWMLLSALIAVGAFAYPALVLAAICVAAMLIGLWIVIKLLPLALGMTFVHLMFDRDI